MTSWLDPLLQDPTASVVAEGFGAVFRLQVAAIAASDPRLLNHYDEAWSTVIPQADVGPYDYIGDLVGAERSTLIAGAEGPERELQRDLLASLRVLRAVYRFGLLSWILDDATRRRSDDKWLESAQAMEAHFGDAGALTFVAGKALEVANDRRLAWWDLLLRPRDDDRVAVASFEPALIRAYLSVLMDLPAQSLLPEPWFEKHQVALRSAIAEARPLADERSGQDSTSDALALAERQERLATAVDDALRELERERGLRVRDAEPLPERVELFTAQTRRSWGSHRVLIALLRELGAPSGTIAKEPRTLLQTALGKAAFVGETASLSLRSLAEREGRQAAKREAQHLLEQLAERARQPAGEAQAEATQPLITRVHKAIYRLREQGLHPTLILARNDYKVWSRLGADRSGSADDVGDSEAAKYFRGRVDGVMLFTPPGLDGLPVLVLDASQAVVVSDAKLSASDLSVRVAAKSRAEAEAGLLDEHPDLSEEEFTAKLDQLLEEVVVRIAARPEMAVANADAVAAVGLATLWLQDWPGPT